MDVTSDRFKIAYEVHPQQGEGFPDTTTASRLKLNKIFEQLETGRMEKLEEITKAVRKFDRLAPVYETTWTVGFTWGLNRPFGVHEGGTVRGTYMKVGPLVGLIWGCLKMPQASADVIR